MRHFVSDDYGNPLLRVGRRVVRINEHGSFPECDLQNKNKRDWNDGIRFHQNANDFPPVSTDGTL
jgi:hypothetical protein